MSHSLRDVVIVGACRTPMGGFGGMLSSLSAAELGAVAIRQVLSRAALPFDQIGDRKSTRLNSSHT